LVVSASAVSNEIGDRADAGTCADLVETFGEPYRRELLGVNGIRMGHQADQPAATS